MKNLSYVRQQLILATADLSGATKGQLVAFAENAQFTATRRSNKRVKVADPVTGRMINPGEPPIPGKQTRAKGSSIALVQPTEYSTASWRRAVLALEEHQRAWLLWNYSDNIRFEHQVTLTQWAWKEFSTKIEGRRIAGKTIERLKALIWLAAQDVKSALAGGDAYQHADLAGLVGVKPDNWCKHYAEHWMAMLSIFTGLDGCALSDASETRYQQKYVFSQQGIAKVN